MTGNKDADCRDLRMMTRLARVAGPPDVASIVASQAELTCAVGGDVRKWSNGKTARISSSSWRYPNGETAKVGTTWRYPNGHTAKVTSNSWRYPDNKAAKVTQHSWRRPDGASVNRDDLLTWACGRVGADNSRVHLADINGSTGDEQDMAVIELAWLASQM
jgi:hypothetical protein